MIACHLTDKGKTLERFHGCLDTLLKSRYKYLKTLHGIKIFALTYFTLLRKTFSIEKK